jgi:hypothetical protein
MVSPQHPLAVFQRALVQCLGFLISPLAAEYATKIVDACQCVRMVYP